MHLETMACYFISVYSMYCKEKRKEVKIILSLIAFEKFLFDAFIMRSQSAIINGKWYKYILLYK